MVIELKYDIKEREEDILADTRVMPFKPMEQFGDVKEGEWHNMLFFGDNLEALKYLKKLQDEGKLEKIKLIYIDPPFGSGDVYTVNGEIAYSSALQGAEFIEFLRKRLIFLREVLADDGSIYVRIDHHFGHYIKVIMDEIFGKNNFRNEIVVKRTRTLTGRSKRFHSATDSVYFYAFGNYTFNGFKKAKENPKWVRMHFRGVLKKNPERIFFGKKLKPPKGRKWVLSQEAIESATALGLIKWDEKLKEPLFYTKWETLDSNWTDIPGYTFHWGYPNENSEQLLERVISASSNPGDIVLDCFAGSGTTGAVAEKLGRRWIMVDSSKLAIRIMIKRMHNLKKEIGNKGEPLKPRPFVLYNTEDNDFVSKIGEENAT